MPNHELMMTEVIEELVLTVEQLSALCSVEPDWVIRHIDDGLLPASRLDSGEWRLSAIGLTRAKRMLSIEKTFDAEPELAALVADMQEELERLRRQLQLAGLA